jgi:hypothetical protein
MALANYADLVTAVHGWLNRADLAAIIPDMIVLAESEFNRVLRVMEMESTATSPAAAAVAKPADFAGMRWIKIGDYELDQVTPADLASMDDVSGTARVFALYDDQFHFRAVPTSGTVTLAYYAKIPPLTAIDPVNWLMTGHPDLYLFATLAQAEFYVKNDARIEAVKARSDQIMGQIMQAEIKARYGNKPLVQGSHKVRSISAVRA